MFHRTRSAAGATSGGEDGVPVCSRPIDELMTNFYDFEGERANLNHRVILKGKMGALHDHVSGVNDAAVISGREFKGIAGGLGGFVEAEYILVCYRDYSPWASSHFPQESTGSWLNPFAKMTMRPYVKKHFAVKLGSSPGVFVPLSEPQFFVGCNKLHMRRGAASSPTSHNLTQFEALSQEQFSTILNIRAPDELKGDKAGAGSSGSAGGGNSGGGGFWASDDAASSGGLWGTLIGYTPLGYYRRVRDEAYTALGRGLVSLLIASVSAYVAYAYLVRPIVGSLGGRGEDDRRGSGGGGGRRGAPSRGSYRRGTSRDYDDGEPGSPYAEFAKYKVRDAFDRILYGGATA